MMLKFKDKKPAALPLINFKKKEAKENDEKPDYPAFYTDLKMTYEEALFRDLIDENNEIKSKCYKYGKREKGVKECSRCGLRGHRRLEYDQCEMPKKTQTCYSCRRLYPCNWKNWVHKTKRGKKCPEPEHEEHPFGSMSRTVEFEIKPDTWFKCDSETMDGEPGRVKLTKIETWMEFGGCTNGEVYYKIHHTNADGIQEKDITKKDYCDGKIKGLRVHAYDDLFLEEFKKYLLDNKLIPEERVDIINYTESGMHGYTYAMCIEGNW